MAFDKQLNFIISAVDKATWPIKNISDSMKKEFGQISWTTLNILNKKLEDLKKELDDVDVWSKRFKELTAEIKKTERELSLASSWMTKFQWKLRDLKPAFQNMATYWSAATLAIASLGTMAVQKASQLQDLRIELNTLTGSAEKWGKMFSQILKDAAKTPFESTDLVKAQSTMLQFGVAQDKVRDSMMMLGDISWGNAQKLQSLALVFGQVNAAWKLTGQDLLQLVNLWFNPLKEISEKTGESMESLRDKMSDGQISFEMIQESMKRATSEGWLFFGMMEAKSQTFSGVMSTLRDNVGIALAALWWFANGEVVEWWLLDMLTKAVNTLTPYLEKISKRASENPEMAKNIFLVIAAITVLITTIWLLWLAIPPIMAWFWVLTWWLTAVKVAFIAIWWPITILIALIAALAVATYTNWDKIKQWFKDWTEAVGIYMGALNTKSETHWMKMKQWASDWTTAMYWYWEALKTNLETVMINIQNWLSTAWSNIVETTKSYIAPLIDRLSSKFDAVVSFVNKIKSALSSVWWAISWWSSTEVAWARANGWPVWANKTYLVWERWPELFTPWSSGKITPNNELWWGKQVSLTIWSINVSNEADEDRLIQKIEQVLIRKDQLYNYWVL